MFINSNIEHYMSHVYCINSHNPNINDKLWPPKPYLNISSIIYSVETVWSQSARCCSLHLVSNQGIHYSDCHVHSHAHISPVHRGHLGGSVSPFKKMTSLGSISAGQVSQMDTKRVTVVLIMSECL